MRRKRTGSLARQLVEQSPPAALPTHVRYHIIGLLIVVSALTYMDRLNLSIAGKYIQDEFAFSTRTMGWLLSAFVWGYALFQIPGGWLGDKYGPRRVLTIAVIWWSAFTAGTAIAPHLARPGWFAIPASFAAARFMVGVGEASTFPNANKIVAHWTGHAHRALGNSVPFVGIGVGGSATPLLVAWMMRRWGWRTAFYVCGMLGLLIALIWNRYAADRPERHPGVNAAELRMIRSGRDANPLSAESKSSLHANPPWKEILSSRSVWALIGSA